MKVKELKKEIFKKDQTKLSNFDLLSLIIHWNKCKIKKQKSKCTYHLKNIVRLAVFCKFSYFLDKSGIITQVSKLRTSKPIQKGFLYH